MEKVFTELEPMQTSTKHLAYLREKYLAMYLFIMTKKGMKEEMENYQVECKALEDDWENFSSYVHGYWLPYIQK